MKRFQMDLSPEEVQLLDELARKSGAGSRAETVRRALQAYDWLVGEADPDGSIRAYTADEQETAKAKVKLFLKRF